MSKLIGLLNFFLSTSGAKIYGVLLPTFTNLKIFQIHIFLTLFDVSRSIKMVVKIDKV